MRGEEGGRGSVKWIRAKLASSWCDGSSLELKCTFLWGIIHAEEGSAAVVVVSLSVRARDLVMVAWLSGGGRYISISRPHPPKGCAKEAVYVAQGVSIREWKYFSRSSLPLNLPGYRKSQK